MAYSSSEPAFRRALPFCLTPAMCSLDQSITCKPRRRKISKHKQLFSRIHRAVAATTTLLLFCTMTMDTAWAVKRLDKAIYGYSTAPYWSVGDYSQSLSRACQQRLFGQKRQFRYVIAFVGQTGRAITGIASKNWNLYDPRGLALPGQTYHFFNDGYSNCSVYVAQQPLN